MKAYTLSILSKLAGDQSGNHPVVDKQVVAWANEKVCCFFTRLGAAFALIRWSSDHVIIRMFSLSFDLMNMCIGITLALNNMSSY